MNGRWSFGATKLLAFGALAVLGGWGLRKAASAALEGWADRTVSLVTQEPYQENLLEVLSQFRRVGVQRALEIDLRASTDRMLLRPLGTPKAMPDFSGLMFNLAQLGPLPTPHDRPVRMDVTIGPKALRPLEIAFPVMISGMGYGVFMSRAAKLAIARAANMAGTATNTGEGPFLMEERHVAHKLIVQYHRGNWMNLDALTYADAVEIHIGQGASGSVGSKLPPEKVTKALKETMGLEPHQDVEMRSTFPELAEGRGLAPLVERARALSDGAPVLVKLAASHRIEHDLAVCLQAGVDGVVIDGAQAGSGQSPPISQDDFGIPTLYGLVRARRFLDDADPEGRVSLIVSGGLCTPGDFLKCLALGADAVYIGTAAILALMTGQQSKATPGEPPTQVITYQGKEHHAFDPDKGTIALARYLRNCRLEMEYGLRLLGKDDVLALGPDDLCALDEQTAIATGVEPAYRAPQATRSGREPSSQRRRRR